MKTSWQSKRLGEICDFIRGLTYTKKDEVNFSNNVVLRATNVDVNTNTLDLHELRYIRNDFHIPDNKKALRDSIIICTASGSKNHLGKVALVDKDYDYAFGGFMAKISPHKEISSKFLFYILTSNLYRDLISNLSNGVNINNLKFDDLKHFEIAFPSLDEQKRIVQTLDEIFDEVTKAKAGTEKNLQNSKDLFESYLQSVFANPKNNWDEKKLGDICGFVRGPFGSSLKKNIFRKEGYAVYEQQHAINNQFTNVRYFVDERKFNEMRRFELSSGDLIMSCSGTMGKVAIVPNDFKRGIINQALLKLSPQKSLLSGFLKYRMESGVFQDDLKNYTKGAAIKNVVSVKILKDIKLFIPTIKEQEDIVKKLDELSIESEKLEIIYTQKLADLEELKKSVLAKAFRGEL